mmetsp:Transcript_29962/g.88880  ORF Transcript_29962/g.88880 Transcript_29962/m.88880 type:complete len:83 (+) Transcript_29962:1880-2128(+)
MLLPSDTNAQEMASALQNYAGTHARRSLFGVPLEFASCCAVVSLRVRSLMASPSKDMLVCVMYVGNFVAHTKPSSAAACCGT